MARSYHIDIARDVVDADRKWVDNLLSHFKIPGVECAQRGIPRRISASGVHHVALIRHLTQQLGLGVGGAVALAGKLLDGADAELALPVGLELRFDQAAFEQDVDRRIHASVESVTPARRGRPPQQVSRR
ncbi:MAG: hypothetical protein ABJF01_02885 [bacterium]